MNAPIVNRRYSLRIASKAGSCDESDTQSVISASVGVRTRRSCATAVKARRSARLAKLPRVCYAGMDEE